MGEEVPSGASIVLQVQLPGGLWSNATGAVSGERYRLVMMNHVIDQPLLARNKQARSSSSSSYP